MRSFKTFLLMQAKTSKKCPKTEKALVNDLHLLDLIVKASVDSKKEML